MTAPRPWRLTPLCLALALACGSSFAAAPVRPLSPLPRAASAADSRHDEALAARQADEQYDQAVLSGRLSDTYRTLEAQADAASPAQRATLLLQMARLQWREGRWSDADETVDRALAAQASLAAWRFKGELLDAGGQPRQAVLWLSKARDATADARERERLGLRIAVMQATSGDAEALARFAQHAPTDQRWRAARVLGLLGQPGRALGLVETIPTPAKDAARGARWEAEMRMADWALGAGDGARARRHAWLAVEHGASATERRYALAVWVEAWRAGHDLAGAVDVLAQRPASPEFTQVRVDLLLELGRTDEALDWVRRSTDPALRQRLLAVLQATGRTAEVEREYGRLITEQPAQLKWVESLAEMRLSQGDQAGAVKVYQHWMARNRDQAALVVEAARSMIARGLADPAMDLLRQMPGSTALTQASRRLLFERYLDQGREAEALAILDTWRVGLPVSSPEMAEVAEGYERLGRPAQALALLQAWQAAGGALDDDQQVHVAELMSSIGQDKQALAQWRALWARARLPVRKDFLERKVVSTAKRLGLIKTLADELQASQERGQASSDDISLLLSLRIASFDGPGAQAAVQTYAKQGKLSEQARLEQLARVYARMRDVPALVRTLRGLAHVDPEGAPDYLRQALQTLLQQPASRPGAAASSGGLSGEIGEIVTELQAHTGLGNAENSRYLAGIYAAAGQSAQALALYRKALSQAPGDSDSLLQLADALKRNGKTLEATALLQQAALRARNDGDFSTAVSGLLDLFGANPDGRDDGDSSLGLKASRLSWALRQVLTHIADSGDDVRFNSLVADIALAQENPGLQLRAYEAALPIAQDQRAAVLRQLIALTSEQKGGAEGGRARAADLPRKIAYGRRLVALRQDFAASVYADLARAMLSQGDAAGAERAFAMVDDNGGLTNVAALRARAYAEVGRTEAALAHYRLALLRDPDDVATVVAASILRERQGQPDLAWQAYWQGLLGLLRRQPLLRDAQSEATALDADQYLPTLLEGVLLNWPQDAQSSGAALTAWKQLFEETMDQVDPGRPLSDHVRMQALVRVNRRLAEQVAVQAGLPALEDALLHRLPNDRRFEADRRAEANRIGRSVQSLEGPDWPLLALSQQAADQEQSSLVLVLALMRRDDEAVQACARRALAAERAGREAQRANVVQPPGALGAWIGAVRSAVGRLPAHQLEALFVRPLEESPFRDEVLFDLYRGDLMSFEKLERSLGRPLLDNATLMDLLTTRAGDPLPEPALRRSATSEPDAASAGLSRFSVDDQLGLLQQMVERMEHGGPGSFYLDTLLQVLLRSHIDNAQQERLLSITARMTALSTPGDDFETPDAAAANLRRLMVLDATPEGQGLLLSMADRFASQIPLAAQLPAFLRAWYAHDDDAAYAAWLGLQDALRDQPNASPLRLPQVTARFEVQRKREVGQFLALAQPDVAQATRFYRRHLLDDAGGGSVGPVELVQRYRALLRAVPDSPLYLSGLLGQDLQNRDLAAFAQDLAPYVSAQSGDREAATLLGLAYRLNGQPQRAAEVAQAAGIDLDDVDWLVSMWDVGRAARPGNGSDALRGLFPGLFDLYRDRPEMPTAVRDTLPERLKPGATDSFMPQQSPWQALLEDAEPPTALRAGERNGASLSGRLRERWRESLSVSAAEPGGRAQLVAALPSPDAMPGDTEDATRLRQLFLTHAELTDELDAELRALAPVIRQSQDAMYALVAQGLTQQGRADARRSQLLQALAGTGLDDHGLHLLGALLEAQGQGLSPGELALLEQRLKRQPSLPPGERLLFARVFARAGQGAIAESLLRATVLQLLYPGPQDGSAAGASPSLAQAVKALSLWRDPQRAAAVYQALATMVAESREQDGTGGRHPEPFPPAASVLPARAKR